MPKVSVIIPAHNQGRFLRQAIDSVLAQDFADYEVLIIDDGSTDDTARVAQSATDRRVRYIRQEHRGVSAARNTGVMASEGSYLAFLDSDDVFCEEKLRKQVLVLDGRSDLGMVVGGYQYIDVSGAVLGEERPWLGQAVLDLGSVLTAGFGPPSTVLVRRSWFERVGGFDCRFSLAEDTDLWYRLSLAGCRIDWVPTIVSRYRIHTSNASRSVKRHYQALTTVLDKLFSNANVPDSVWRRRGEVYARARLSEAGKLYGTGDWHGGKQALEVAIREDPSLLCENVQRLIVQMAEWENSAWAADPGGMLDRVLKDLPSDLATLSGFSLELQRTRDKMRFYRAFRAGDRRRVRHLWIALARSDAGWLLNRGNWSILLRSLGWFPNGNGRNAAS